MTTHQDSPSTTPLEMVEIGQSNGVEDNYSGVNIVSTTLSATNGLKKDSDIEKAKTSSGNVLGAEESSLSANDGSISSKKSATDKLSVHSNTEKVSPSCKPRQETFADWWVLVCVFLFNAHTGFNLSAYSVLYVPLTELFDTTRSAIGWIQSIEFALSYFLGLLVSHPMSVYGCRITSLVGAILVFVGGTLSCFAPNLGWMYFLKAFVSGIGLSSCMLASNVIIQQRFDAHRGLATSISVIGLSVGNFSSPPLVNLMLEKYSTRGTLALLGAIQAHRIPLALQLRTPPSHLMQRKEPATQESTSSDKAKSLTVVCHRLSSYLKGSLDFSLLRHPSFTLFCAAGVLQKFTFYSYIPHTVNWAMTAGVSRQVGVWAVSVISFTTLAQRLVVALISDCACVSRTVFFAIGTFLSVLSPIPPLLFPGLVSTFISVITFGMHAGITNTLLAVVIVDILGVRHVTRCLALLGFFTGFPILIASPLVGAIYDEFGDYFYAFILFIGIGLMGLLSMIMVIFLERRKKR